MNTPGVVLIFSKGTLSIHAGNGEQEKEKMVHWMQLTVIMDK